VVKELDVNALNFCRFAIASTPPISGGKGKDKEQEGILVIPSLLDSEYVCFKSSTLGMMCPANSL